MIKLVAKRLVREDCVEAYIPLAKELVARTQTEKGMVYYTLNREVGNDRLFVMLEAWESQKALDAHSASEHFREIVPKLSAMAEQNFPLEKYIEVE
ncbi:MAG: antibiotic biosynthesis monooxygenase [Oscillospiraceae bacterium]|nr:antibiotic biosynthesis monooxygenase [Oscillospiraceae bacterium]